MKTYAVLRDTRYLVNTFGASAIQLDNSPLPCWQPDELDHSEYNLVILHGEELYRVPSIDFEFIDRK
jgi:hypothetical protein